MFHDKKESPSLESGSAERAFETRAEKLERKRAKCAKTNSVSRHNASFARSFERDGSELTTERRRRLDRKKKTLNLRDWRIPQTFASDLPSVFRVFFSFFFFLLFFCSIFQQRNVLYFNSNSFEIDVHLIILSAFSYFFFFFFNSNFKATWQIVYTCWHFYHTRIAIRRWIADKMSGNLLKREISCETPEKWIGNYRCGKFTKRIQFNERLFIDDWKVSELTYIWQWLI